MTVSDSIHNLNTQLMGSRSIQSNKRKYEPQFQLVIGNSAHYKPMFIYSSNYRTLIIPLDQESNDA